MFKKSKISLAVASIAAASAAVPAFAQEEGAIEEVVVTGIRGSLMRAMDVKRDSAGVVDAISAEDMGKFPDTNLAESLQRITGVSIDRVNGEGSQVTVRGFGGGFNMVTLNGRQMPAANVQSVTGIGDDSGAQGASRSFDFSNLASEGVSGIQVYKTGNAVAPSGGIGATINVQTLRPLEVGDQASIGVKAVMDESSQGRIQNQDDITPEISAMFSTANEDGTFGFSIFGSYQERQSSATAVNVCCYLYQPWDPANPDFALANIVNEPAPGQLIAMPWNQGLNYSDQTRERTNVMATLQFAPNDRTTITLDGMYTVNEQRQDMVVPGIWFSRKYTEVEFDGSDIVATPLRIVEDVFRDVANNDLSTARGKDFFNASNLDMVKDEMTSVGFNVEFQATENLSLELDIASSSAESGGNGPRGAMPNGNGGYDMLPVSNWRGNIAAAGAGYQMASYSGGTPTATIGVVENVVNATGNGNGILDAGDMNTQTLIRNYNNMQHDIDQFSLGGTWDAGEGVRVDFGAGYMTTEMKSTYINTTDFLGGWGVGRADMTDPAQQALISEICVTCAFSDLPLNGYNGDGGTGAPAGYVSVLLGEHAFYVNPQEYQALYNGEYGYNYDAPTQTGLRYSSIDEDVVSAFIAATFDSEIGGKAVQTVLGLRYEETEITSKSRETAINEIIWMSDNDFQSRFGSQLDSFAESYKYDNLLPSLDISVDLSDEWKGRASVSQTIARPAYGNLFINTSAGAPNGPTILNGQATGSKGNPALDPLESSNFDMSLEYYYGDASYASIGYFYKKVDNFVGTSIVNENLYGLRDVTNGPVVQGAVAALKGAGIPVTEESLFTAAAILANPADFDADFATAFAGADPFDVLTAYDIAPTAADPLMMFNVAKPVNNKSATVDGWELAIQHFFGESGFGFQANATMVDGDVGYDVRAPLSVEQFAIEGLSDSANFVLMYEDDTLSARVAYNWRDTFLASTAKAAGMPLFIKEYEQIDFNVSYNVNENLVVSLDGINVTGEGSVGFSRTENMQWYNAEADPRYVLSARYSF